jgi:hypothetical protein
LAPSLECVAGRGKGRGTLTSAFVKEADTTSQIRRSNELQMTNSMVCNPSRTVLRLFTLTEPGQLGLFRGNPDVAVTRYIPIFFF